MVTLPRRVQLRLLSVLSVEPYGMKRQNTITGLQHGAAFSALGRAVWDETYGIVITQARLEPFSALGRAVWDETLAANDHQRRAWSLSVLSVEPYGMKPGRSPIYHVNLALSVLSVEPYGMKHRSASSPPPPR